MLHSETMSKDRIEAVSVEKEDSTSVLREA